MAIEHGNLALLSDPVAQQLLHSRIPAKLSYVWTDGSPRVVPVWFEWTGEDVIIAGSAAAPKVRALTKNPRVALTIDTDTWPYRVLQIRGTATVELVDNVVPGYEATAIAYIGDSDGRAWIQRSIQLSSRSARIRIRPEWVSIVDFETRWPSAMTSPA